MFKRIVDVIEALAFAAAAIFVLCLFIVSGEDGGGGGEGEARSGEQVYADSCAQCHGGDGQGGIGPQLADGAVAESLSEQDQIEVITNGRNNMPAFGDGLSAEEIQAVTDFTRGL